jgi:hypothetical protein
MAAHHIIHHSLRVLLSALHPHAQRFDQTQWRGGRVHRTLNNADIFGLDLVDLGVQCIIFSNCQSKNRPIYTHSRSSNKGNSSGKMDTVVVELFSGRGEIAKIAASILDCHYITIDINAKRNPSYVTDIGKWSKLDTASLKRAIGTRKVVMWASPPCEEYSAMNTSGNRDYDRADNLVKMAYVIAKKIKAQVIVFENPGTGKMHERPIMRECVEKKLKCKYTVSYCKYGHPVRKKTHLWCNRDLESFGFKPRNCTNGKHCKSSFYNAETGQYRHLLHFDDYNDYNQRISVPPQLVSDVFKAVKIFMEKEHEQQERQSELNSSS